MDSSFRIASSRRRFEYQHDFHRLHCWHVYPDTVINLERGLLSKCSQSIMHNAPHFGHVSGTSISALYHLWYYSRMVPTLPAETIALLGIFGAFLSYLSSEKVQKLQRSSLLLMFHIGLMIIVPGMLSTGALYLYFGNVPVDIEIRQAFVRISWVYLFSGINIWQLIILKFGKEL